MNRRQAKGMHAPQREAQTKLSHTQTGTPKRALARCMAEHARMRYFIRLKTHILVIVIVVLLIIIIIISTIIHIKNV